MSDGVGIINFIAIKTKLCETKPRFEEIVYKEYEKWKRDKKYQLCFLTTGK